jgi:hypothetical protein
MPTPNQQNNKLQVLEVELYGGFNGLGMARKVKRNSEAARKDTKGKSILVDSVRR